MIRGITGYEFCWVEGRDKLILGDRVVCEYVKGIGLKFRRSVYIKCVDVSL